MKRTIYLAGGCFWGIARLFELVPGVETAEAGYANGCVANPTYEEVCSGRTGAAETVRVVYDDSAVGLTDLLGLYFKAIDPLSVNRQGGDAGTQYRTGIYYSDPDDAAAVEAALATLQRRHTAPLAIESGPLESFYPAEEYHQGYLARNPGGYCHVDPRLFREAAALRRPSGPDREELRRRLTPLQWEVTQNAATERPFVNEYDSEFRRGIYVDITDGTPLFLSTDKYNSGCGWPAFTRPISEALIDERPDTSYGRLRTEVRSSGSGAHLGHVFADGPADRGGLRYCINSASLRFVPLDSMAAEGYADLIPYVR